MAETRKSWKLFWKRFLLFLSALLIILITILLINTFRFESKQISVKPVAKIEIPDVAIEHLAGAVRIQTVSYEDKTKFNPNPFLDFICYLDSIYPQVKTNLEKEVVNNYSLLYTWKGSNTALDPIVLLGHIDVVPVEAEALSDWTEGPYSGKVTEKFIWGRGTLDDKVAIIGLLEAVEQLLSTGFTPERTIYFAFGHDEEIGGREGAALIAEVLKSKGVKPAFVLDEGMAVTKNIIPGMDKPVALIGTAEKGFSSLELSLEMEGGHSSMPKEETTIEVLAEAVIRLRENPFPTRITKPVEGFLDYIGPEMPFFKKMVFANRWLFEGVIVGIYEGSNSGNALVRTTIAPTIFNSGFKENVMPTKATATINFRILPGETIKSVKKHVRKTIDDNRIHLKESSFSSNPSPISSTKTYGFKTIHKTIEQLFPESIVAPTLVLGGTDSRHYSGICKNIYRFLPIVVTKNDMKRIHGIDERIAINDFKNVIRFYHQLLKNVNKKKQ
jgi:carboxypeptidase PM20D1